MADRFRRRDHARLLSRARRPAAEGPRSRREVRMNPQLLAELSVFALAVFVGIEVISKVPVVLHTPLMSGTNAIHGIVVVGGILVLGHATSTLEEVLGFTAVAFGAMNLAGGFFVT